MKFYLYFLVFMMIASGATIADDYFDVEGVAFHQTAPPGFTQPTKSVRRLDDAEQPVLGKDGQPVIDQVPIPFISAHIRVKEKTETSSTLLKAYFYDENLKLITTETGPSLPRGDHLPVFMPKDKEQTVSFGLPDNVSSQENWSAVVVFGDGKGVDAQVYGSGSQITDFDFPEKSVLEDKSGPPIERKAEMDPLIEHVVKTDNPKQPQISLFLRPPLGMTDASQAKGVLCLSLLGFSMNDVKRQLQGSEPSQDINGILKFAEDHKLIIICWGSHGLWDPRKNWDDLSPDSAGDTDQAFDQVAAAWSNGIQFFVKEYGIPSNGYLLWGVSGSAQYACRLALRKPEYFLAIHAHIPSSFDKPTPEASKILWCLTTGELESGYQRSLRFYAQCHALGYPMVYKAIIGLGHQGSPIADNLGNKFFEYALSVKDQRVAYDKALKDPLSAFQLNQNTLGPIQPWIESFRKPAFVGDIVNQYVVPYGQENSVPARFQVALPTKEIADAWNH